MKNLKIISDFDGIWTNQEEEAIFVRNYYFNKLSEISKLKISDLKNLFEKIKSDMDLKPFLWGWFYNNLRACYYQEDPFGDNNAIFNYFERNYEKRNELSEKINFLRTKILCAGYDSLDKFANVMFFESTSKFKDENGLQPYNQAEIIIEELLHENIGIVVASNSKTNKIEFLFDKMGYSVSNNESGKRSNIHAIGNAMKFSVDNNFKVLDELLDINKNYQVLLRRQHYYDILMAERPDFIIGDVFSLDIALPLYLTLNNPLFGNLKVIQKVQSHTPQWVKEFLDKDEIKGKAFMINELSELPSLLLSFI